VCDLNLSQVASGLEERGAGKRRRKGSLLQRGRTTAGAELTWYRVIATEKRQANGA
jgi:hypothetical protein